MHLNVIIGWIYSIAFTLSFCFSSVYVAANFSDSEVIYAVCDSQKK